MTMKAYLKQIQGKTAFLFGLACQLGSFVPGQSRKDSSMAFRSGQALGMAFQLRDDLIDYQLDVAESGKPRLQDIQNGIYTAPLLLPCEKTSLSSSNCGLIFNPYGRRVGNPYR